MQEQTLKKISLNHRTYAHADSAPNPAALPVVLLHGLMGYASNWGKIWPALQKERAVLVYDQRGHGRSDKPAHGYSPADYASDEIGLLDELGWARVHIIGQSMGGRVAMRLAQDYPERIAALVLEDSGAESRPNRLDWIRGLLARVPVPFADRDSAKAFFVREFAADPMLAGFLHANIERRDDGKFAWRFLPAAMVETIAAGRALDATEMFRALRAPTLLVRGGRSEEFSQDEAERMRDLRAGVELAVIAEAGHFVHPAFPEEFSEIAARFLALHDPA